MHLLSVRTAVLFTAGSLCARVILRGPHRTVCVERKVSDRMSVLFSGPISRTVGRALLVPDLDKGDNSERMAPIPTTHHPNGYLSCHRSLN